MLDRWLFIGIFVSVAAVFPLLPIVVARFLAPRKPNTIKLETYECGMETVGDTWVQFKVQYYIYALVFLMEIASATSPGSEPSPSWLPHSE